MSLAFEGKERNPYLSRCDRDLFWFIEPPRQAPSKIHMSIEKLAFTLEGKVMSLESTTKKTCCWCVVITAVALTLLALTWTVILASNTSVLEMIKIAFPD